MLIECKVICSKIDLAQTESPEIPEIPEIRMDKGTQIEKAGLHTVEGSKMPGIEVALEVTQPFISYRSSYFYSR